MKILFVAPRPPFPLLQGDRVRAYHLLRQLSRRHEVTLVTPAPHRRDPSAEERIAEICRRWVSVRTPVMAWASSLARLTVSPLPLQTAYATPALQREVQTRLERDSFDLLHVSLARMGPAASRSHGGVPMVLDFVDALSLNMRRRAERERGPLRLALLIEAGRMRRYELALAASFDRTTISSPLDAEWIGAGERLQVVPNGVDLASFPYRESDREARLIVFTGRIGYFPNQDAALFFATEVFPLIQRRVPDARFVIVGADAPPRIRRLARIPGVEVTGTVPRVQDYLERAAVAVAPLRSGTGLQFKALEAMASGAPLVATPTVLAGLAAEQGAHVLVGQGPEQLAEHVALLLREPERRRRLARSARRLVEERYTWERAVELLEESYRLARVGRGVVPALGEPAA